MKISKIQVFRNWLASVFILIFSITVPIYEASSVETRPIVSEISSSGAGGVEFKQDCLPGYLLSGVDGNVLNWRGLRVTSQLQGICIEVNDNGMNTNDNFSYTELSGLSPAGTPTTLSCPKSYAVVGATIFNISSQNYVTGIKLRCGRIPLGTEIVVTRLLGYESNSQDNLQCPVNSFGAGLVIKYGEIVDSFGLRCAKIQDAKQLPITAVSLSSTEKIYPYTEALSITDYQGGSGSGTVRISQVLEKSATGCAFSQGNISAQSSGSCSVIVTKSRDEFYGPTSFTSEFNFIKSPQSIEIASLTTNNQTAELTQNLTPSFINFSG